MGSAVVDASVAHRGINDKRGCFRNHNLFSRQNCAVDSPRKEEDRRPVDDSCSGSRPDDGGAVLVGREPSEQFTKARESLLEQSVSRVDGHIVRFDAGAADGDDGVDIAALCEGSERALNPVVGWLDEVTSGDSRAGIFEDFDDGIALGVLRHRPVGGDRDDGVGESRLGVDGGGRLFGRLLRGVVLGRVFGGIVGFVVRLGAGLAGLEIDHIGVDTRTIEKSHGSHGPVTSPIASQPTSTILSVLFVYPSMQAVQFDEHGDRDVIEYGEFEDPDPGRGEVLVEVKAGALNHLDIWTRKGMPGLDLEMPHIPGSDCAGVVAETGPGATRFEEGDRVALLAGVPSEGHEFDHDGDPTLSPGFHIIGEHVRGVHAEYAALPESNLVEVPEGVDWVTAAAAPLVFQTAWRMLIERGELQAGEDILVLGASGGVGHAAVQIADYTGAEVYATASSDEKLEYAEEVGADHTINYEEDDFAAEIRELTGGRGVDMVVDHVGAQTWQDSLKSLTKGGRLVTCGATTGGRPDTDINRIFWNQLEIIGSTMATPSEANEVLDLVWEGEMEPRIREVLPMSETQRAHEIIEEREGFGKVVVKPDSVHDA